MKILLLGGTKEARDLAQELVTQGHRVISSLAGQVKSPRLPAGEIRIGGFGGISGLKTYITAHSIDLVIDATHPFAAQITSNAITASKELAVPYLNFERPSWENHDDAASWHWVTDNSAAAATIGCLGDRPFLSCGRKTLPNFLDWQNFALVRVVDPLTIAVPRAWKIILSRGPYFFTDELKLIEKNRINLLITKDSGGVHTEAKLEVAKQLGIPVVVISRPKIPQEYLKFEKITEVLAWLESVKKN